MKKKEERKSWIVKVKCEVTKEVVTKDCTREEAEEDLWAYSIDEREVSMANYDILNIQENK